jgi:hydroxymethylpyrimidine kinase/phosphomethylpyrimidine kinase
MELSSMSNSIHSIALIHSLIIMTKGLVLVIAGSDSSGGAGLEADQKVIAAHGCYAMTATTALTAQNTLRVEDIHYTPPEFVRKLIRASVGDVGVDVVKTGTSLTSSD